MRRQRNRLFTLGFLLITALLLVTIGGRTSLLHLLINVLMFPLAPVTQIIDSGADATTGLTETQPDYITLSKQNREMEHTIAELQVEIVRLREIEQDYYRLSGLLDYQSEHPDQGLVTADVIARDTSSYLRFVIINRGARDGVRVGNPVISDLGMVGRVENTAANMAWVRLIIDQSSAINARLQNSRAEGTILGQLQGGLLMDFIPQELVIEEGDLVLTSGLGGNFPAGIVIGQVSSVERQPAELFQKAQIRPTVDFEHLQIVSVVVSFEPFDTTTFDNMSENQP